MTLIGHDDFLNSDFLSEINKLINDYPDATCMKLILIILTAEVSLSETVRLARFDIICFIHLDVLLNTLAWGEKLRSIFELQPEVGVIGVAGSKYKSRYSSGWYTSIKEFDCANIVHRSEKGD